jgi:hypothetical protein
MPKSLPRVEMFLSKLSEQALFKDENTQGSIHWYITYYQSRAPKRRWAFRSAGFMLLFLSISLPVVSQVASKDIQPQVTSTLAWLIAIVAAANSFFNWQQSWQLFTQAELALRFAVSEWSVRTAEAYAASTDDEGMKILELAVQQLVKTVRESVTKETSQYFQGVKVPDV